MIIGLDTGAVDNNGDPNYVKAKVAGASFIYLKKSQHIFPDARYAPDSAAARKAGLLVGAYLFPSFSLRAADPKTQVAAFKAAAGDIVPHKDLPPALDVECPGGFRNLGRPLSDVVALLQMFVYELEDAFGCLPAVYTSQEQWYDLGCPSAPWIMETPLWVKTAYRLTARQPLDQVVAPMPHVGASALDPKDYYRVPDPWVRSGWWANQVQGDCLGFPGFTSTVDVNRFNLAKIGDKGPHIMWLQRRLKLVADGDFGPATEAAVRALQAAHGLLVDGQVGPRTFAAVAWA